MFAFSYFFGVAFDDVHQLWRIKARLHDGATRLFCRVGVQSRTNSPINAS